MMEYGFYIRYIADNELDSWAINPKAVLMMADSENE